MAEGYEIRQVVQDPNNPSGRANQPARQIAGIGVQAPRGGDMSQVGAQWRVLSEVAKMGGDAMQNYLVKAQEEDRLKGQMLKAQGETAFDLKEAGVNQATMEGWQGLDLKMKANQWQAQKEAEIDTKWADKPPEEFQASLMADWKTIADGVDPNDMHSVKMLGKLSDSVFGGLVRKQTLTHAAFSEKAAQGGYTGLVVSESELDNPASLKEIVDNTDKLLPNASPEGRRDALFRSVRETLGKGNMKVYAAMEGMEGARKRGATEAELNGLEMALKKGQTENESKYMADISANENEIMLDLNKTGDVKTAQNRTKQLQEQYNLSPDFVRSMGNKIQTVDFTQKLTAQETGILTNPEYLNDMEGVVAKTKWGDLDNAGAVAAVEAVAAKHKLSPEFVKSAYGQMQSARNQYIASQDAKLKAKATEVQKNINIDIKATALRGANFNNIGDYKPEEVRRAFQQQRQAIADAVMKDPNFQTTEDRTQEMINRHVDFLRGVPVRDEQVKNEFAAALQGSPLDDKGMVRPDVVQSFQYMQTMRDAGLSERAIKDYVGDGYDYLNTAVEFGTAVSDPKLALAASYQMMESKREGLPPPKTNEMIAEYEKKRTKYFDELEPSMIGAWLGAEEGSSHDQILTDQVTEAAKGSEDMDVWMQTRIKTFANMYPNMKPSAITNLAMKDMSKWEYVLGTMVKPVGTKSLSEEMGVDSIPGKLVSNAAMLTYLADNGDKLWPEGTEERNWVTRIKDGAATTGNTIFYTPEKIEGMLRTGRDGNKTDMIDMIGAVATGLGKAQNVVMSASEKEQRLANDIKMVDIQPMSNGNLIVQLYQDTDKKRPVGVPRMVPAKEIGTYYKAKRKAELFEKNTVRRDEKLN